LLGAALARIETRIDAVLDDSRRHLNAEIERLLPLLDGGNAAGIADGLARIDAMRDELDQKIDGIRSDMLALVRSDAAATLQRQHDVIWIAAALTAIAANLGVLFSVVVRCSRSGHRRLQIEEPPPDRQAHNLRAKIGKFDHVVFGLIPGDPNSSEVISQTNSSMNCVGASSINSVRSQFSLPSR
jgi:hypothetical protein